LGLDTTGVSKCELDALRVDQDHPHVVRRRPQQHGRQQGVDAARLTRPGRAGDQQVRHPRQVSPYGGAGDVLAEPDRERARRRREVVEDVAERDEVRREVRQLDADRLLAGDRREDPDLRRRERIGEIVLQRCNLRDLGARRELQLVARYPRAGDLADDRRLDAEVRERLHERGGGALGHVFRHVARCRGLAQDAAIGQLVLLVRLHRADVEERRLVRVLRRGGLDQQRRRLVLADDVGVVVHGVDRRLECRTDGDHRCSRRLRDRVRRQRAPSAGVRTPNRVARPAHERPCRCTGKQQRPDHQCQHADDRCSGRADEQPEELLEAAPERAAVGCPEGCQQAEARDDQSGPEWADVDEGAAGDHQRADDDKGDRSDVRRCTDGTDEGVGDPAADHSPAPTKVEDRGEEDSETNQPEPDQLVVLLAADLSALPCPLLDARRHAWPKRTLLLPTRHARDFRRAGAASYYQPAGGTM
jgi:hypothetical protein